MDDPYWGDSETNPIEDSYLATIRLQASDYLTISSHVYIRPYLKAYISNMASLSLAIVSFVSLIMYSYQSFVQSHDMVQGLYGHSQHQGQTGQVVGSQEAKQEMKDTISKREDF